MSIAEYVEIMLKFRFKAASEPSGNCPRKWGLFKIGNSCGDFVNCVGGIEHVIKCPEGLAWHPTLWRCEWPDQVPTCNVEGMQLVLFFKPLYTHSITYTSKSIIEFLGFKCPSVDEVTAAGNPSYPHPVTIDVHS